MRITSDHIRDSPKMRSFKRKTITYMAFLLFCGFVVSSANAMNTSGQALSNPLDLYGNGIEFDVFRDGKKVGKHSVRFEETPSGKLKVTARLDLRVTFLGIPVYDYAYHSIAQWRKGRLVGLAVKIDDDGEKSAVSASMQGEDLVVVGPKGKMIIPYAIFPTNHWNAVVLSRGRVLNTLSGEISQVKISKQGSEKIRAEGRLIEATKYQYAGDIDTSVWYDDKGRWVKMRFPAKSGSVIDYECTACGIILKRNMTAK